MGVDVHHVNGEIRISATASDRTMVDAIDDFPDFRTGGQGVANVQLYLDVHPDDYRQGDLSWDMESVGSNGIWDSDEETSAGLVLQANSFSPGKYTFFLQATDSDGYKGPVHSMFVEVSESEASAHGASLRGTRTPFSP